MPTREEKKAAEEAEALRERTLKEGRFAAAESDDNSVDASNDAYVGVDPEYRNHADYGSGEDGGAVNAPLKSEDEQAAALETQAKEHEDAVLATQPGFRGYEPTTPHPTEATQPAAATIDKNRAITDAAAAEAAASQQTTTETTTGDGDGDKGSAPFSG